MDVLNAYLEILLAQFQYDIAVLSQGWMYYLLLIPVMFYLMFFMAKWAVLTAPIWLPISLIVKAFRGDSTQESEPSTRTIPEPHAEAAEVVGTEVHTHSRVIR